MALAWPQLSVKSTNKVYVIVFKQCACGVIALLMAPKCLVGAYSTRALNYLKKS